MVMIEQYETMQQQQQYYAPLMILSSDESLVALASPLYLLPAIHDNNTATTNSQQQEQVKHNNTSSSFFPVRQKQKQHNNIDDSNTNATTVTSTGTTTTSNTTIVIGYQINIWNADNEQLVTSFEYRHSAKKDNEEENIFPKKIIFFNNNNTHLGIIFNDIINVWDISLRRISYEIRIANASSVSDNTTTTIDNDTNINNITAIYDVIPFQNKSNSKSSLFVLTAPAVLNKTRFNNHHHTNNTNGSASIDDTNSFHTIDDNSIRIERSLYDKQQQQQQQQEQQQQEQQQQQLEFDLDVMHNDKISTNNNNNNVISVCCWWQQILEFDSISGRFIRPVAAWECPTYDDMITAKLGFCSSNGSNSNSNSNSSYNVINKENEDEEQYLIVTSSSTVRVFNPIDGTEVWNLEHKENYDCFNTGTCTSNRLPFFLGGAGGICTAAAGTGNNNNVVLSTTTGSYVAIVQDDCTSNHNNNHNYYNNNASMSKITSNHYNNLSLINIVNGTVLKHNSPTGTNIYSPSSSQGATSATTSKQCQLIEGSDSNNCLLLRVDNHIYAIELVHSGSIVGIDNDDDINDDDNSFNNNNNSYKIRKRTRLVMNSNTDCTIDGNKTTTSAFVLRVNRLEQTVEVIAIDTTISTNQAALSSSSSSSTTTTKLDSKKSKKRNNIKKSSKKLQQEEIVAEETLLVECACLQQHQFEKFTLVPLNNIMALENGDYIDIDSVTTTSTSTSNSSTSSSKQYQQQQQQQQVLQQFHNSIILPNEIQPELAAAWFSKRAQQVQAEAERKNNSKASSSVSKPITIKRSRSLNTNSNHSRNGSTGHEMLQSSGSFADSIMNDHNDDKVYNSTATNGTSSNVLNSNILTAKTLNLHLHNTSTEKSNGNKQQQHTFNSIMGNGFDEDSSYVSTTSKAFSERTEKTEITSNMMFLHSNSLGNSIINNNNNNNNTISNPCQNTANLVSSLYLRKTKSNMTASSDGNVTDDEDFLPIRSHTTSYDYSDDNNNNNDSSIHTHNATYSGHYRKILVVDTPTRSIGSKTQDTVGSSTPGDSVISTSDVHNRTLTTISTTMDRTTITSSNKKQKQKRRKSRPLREWIVTFGIPLFFIILLIVLASVFTMIAIRKRQENKIIEAQVADTLNDDDRLVSSVSNGVTRKPPTISPAPTSSPSPSSSTVDGGDKDDDGTSSSATISPIPTAAILDDDGIGSETSIPTTTDFDRHNSDGIVDRNTSNIMYSSFTVSSSSFEQFIGNTTGELFGTSVDISSQGNILAISSPVARIDGNRNCGKVDIYERQNQKWVLRNAATIVKVSSGNNNNTVPTSSSSSILTGPGPNSRFGTLLSMNANGSIVAVSLGERNASRARRSMDSVNMYKYDNVLQEYVTMGLPLTLNDTTDHKFGSSFQVSASGRYIVVGSPNVGNSTNKAYGMVSVYMFNDLLQDWTLYGKQLFGSKSNDALGTVVTIYEDTVLGNLTIASSAPNTNYNRGYVKVWRYNVDKQAWAQLGNSLTYYDVVPTNEAATKTTKSIFGSSLSLSKIFDNERRARFVIGLGIPIEEEIRTNFNGSNSNNNNNSSKVRQRTYGRAAVFELRKRNAYTIPNTEKVSTIKSRYWAPIGNSISSHTDVDTFEGYIVKFLPPSNEDSGIILAISTPGTTTTKQTETVKLYHAISPFNNQNNSITTWEQVDGSENLLTGDARNDHFGTSIALTRTTDSIVIAVGAPQTNQTNSSGYVTVFTIN